MLAGDLELTTLVLDLQEQPCILDSQGRLSGEGGEQAHDLRLELAGGLARHRQDADDFVFAKERHAEQSAMSGVDKRLANRTLAVTRRRDVVNLYGLAPLDHPGGDALAVPAAPAGGGVWGWERDGLGTGARGRGAEGVDVDYALCLRLQRGAACGAGGVMAWKRGAGKGREGAEGVDVDYAPIGLPK